MPNEGALGDHCTACASDEVCKASHLYVIELRSPDLYASLNPVSDEEATLREANLADHLRLLGYAVWCN